MVVKNNVKIIRRQNTHTKEALLYNFIGFDDVLLENQESKNVQNLCYSGKSFNICYLEAYVKTFQKIRN